MKTWSKRLIFAAVLGLLLAGSWLYLFPPYWNQTRAVAYDTYRQYGRTRALTSLDGYLTASSKHFVLYFRPEDADAVDLILETAESVYGPVVALVGRRPSDPVPILLYASRREMRSAFGWGNGESALGVYWKGTVRLLSPNVWIGQENEETRNRVFRRMNPIAHELTHYILDYETSGNYTRWFSEGLAQWVEYHVSGYLWIESDSSLRQALYTMEDLERRFSALPNQALAYRQSYLLVTYLEERFGSESLLSIVDHLKEGHPLDTALQRAVGLSSRQLHTEWKKWLEENLDLLEPEGLGV